MKYYKYKIENLIKINNIITVHYFDFDKPFLAPTESHDFWEIVYAEKNPLICYSDGKEVNLSQGEIYFHKPNESHALKATEKNAFIIISFECKSEACGFFKDKKIRLKEDNLKFIYSIIKEAKKTFNIPYSDPKVKKMPLSSTPTLGGLQLIKNYLEILLINILRDETEKDGKNKIFIPSTGGGLAQKIIKLLNENIEGSLSIEEIVNKLNYSKTYVFRSFKKQTGTSVIAYYNHLKIERAKTLLVETDLTLTKISDSLCFDTQSYFSKTFKKLTGYSPLHYRKIFK